MTLRVSGPDFSTAGAQETKSLHYAHRNAIEPGDGLARNSQSELGLHGRDNRTIDKMGGMLTLSFSERVSVPIALIGPTTARS